MREVLADHQLTTASAAPTTPEHLTYDQAAKLANTSKGTIRNWINAGKLKAVGVGRAVRVRRADLEALMSTGDSGDAPPSITKQVDAIVLKLQRK